MKFLTQHQLLHAHHSTPVFRQAVRVELSPGIITLINIGFTISIAVSVALMVVTGLRLAQSFSPDNLLVLGPSITYLALETVNVAGCLAIAVFDFNTHMSQARHVARATMTTLIASVVVGIVAHGISPVWLLSVFQFVCIVVFQTYTDEMLARNKHFCAPWDTSSDSQRTEYIPLNFFNLFWVFTISSIMGLCVEVLYFAIVFDAYPDRAGLLWGPFSPIYGFGATLMTIALNRYWNRSVVVIFFVAGSIGAAFEFATSLFMETAFGIVAWDYSGTFLNIQGRTNFAFFCAWGLLGLLWIKVFLPRVLKLVDAIPVTWRITLTSLAAALLMIDGVMTLITVDCWYLREAGYLPINAIEEFCAEHYDNTFMQQRFESMNLDPSKAERLA